MAKQTLNPYLNFRDTARTAMEFYKSIFGGELTMNTFAEFGQSGVLMRKNQPALKDAVDKALDALRDDGTYKQISERYFGEDLSAKVK